MAVRSVFRGSWKYRLDRMSFQDLTSSYLRYPAVWTYGALMAASAAVATVLGARSPEPRTLEIGLAALAGFAAYPFGWYLIHRFVLHGQLLYRFSWSSSLWKRIHYDHHRNPRDLRVLFGALYTTLPTVGIVLLPIGALIGGAPGAAAAFAAGLAGTLFYEYCHCVQHLGVTPKSPFLRRIKRLHLLHHYHDETGNFGITNFLWDRVFGTYYEQAEERPRSETVFNLGYAGEERARYPWVAELSEGEG
jgi:sterol desaturase/sphingolipid hydroxylase (fatty acid hydroxylase superfamily)